MYSCFLWSPFRKSMSTSLRLLLSLFAHTLRRVLFGDKTLLESFISLLGFYGSGASSERLPRASPRRPSARRPRHEAPTEQVKMQVNHARPGVRPLFHNEPIAPREPEVRRDLSPGE